MHKDLRYILLVVLPLLWTACRRDLPVDLPVVEPVPGLEEGAVGFGAVKSSGAVAGQDDYLHNTFIHDVSYLRIYNYTGTALDFNDNADYKWYVYDEDLGSMTGGMYNFRPLEGRGFLWSELEIEGTVGYKFDAIVFPYYQKYRDTVSVDQSVAGNFLASDILMAHHIQFSGDFGKRVALKFYHVLSMLKVMVYIPKYDAATNTGFGKDAASDIVLPDIYTKFSFSFDTALSSDAAPVVMPHTSSNKPDDCPKGDISMYALYDKSELTGIGEGTDSKTGRECWICSFAAILPVQELVDENALLRLTLKTVDGQKRVYQYTPGVSKAVSIVAGSITSLHLSIREEENKAFLMKAEVMPWEQASADMGLEKE